METALFNQLKKYARKRRISFAMPGHKGRGLNGEFLRKIARIDTTELDQTANLHYASDAVVSARKKASSIFGAKDTFFLVNGSTAGIYAMLGATCNPGDAVLVNRACHISVINACVLLGIKPIFIKQDIATVLSVPMSIDPNDVKKGLEENNVRAVLITTPSYYGICSNVSQIAQHCHRFNVPLLVDEAHGTHFIVEDRLFPKTALVKGADVVVQSGHKTIDGLTQTAMLHINSNRVDKKRLENMLIMLQSSSPSYILAASLDLAINELSTNDWVNAFEACEKFKNTIKTKTRVICLGSEFVDKKGIYNVDETRLVLNFSHYNITGFEVSRILRDKYRIDIEMADLFNIVCIATPNNNNLEYRILARAIIKIVSRVEESGDEPAFFAPVIPNNSTLPQEAFYKKGEFISLDMAVERTSKSTITAYPPAVPIIVVGERITKENINYIKALLEIGATVTGLDEKGRVEVVG